MIAVKSQIQFPDSHDDVFSGLLHDSLFYLSEHNRGIVCRMVAGGRVIYLVVGEKGFEAVDIVVVEILLVGGSVFQLVHEMIGNVQGIFEGSDHLGSVAVLAVSVVHAVGEALQLLQFSVVDGRCSLHLVIVVQPIRYLQLLHNPFVYNLRFQLGFNLCNSYEPILPSFTRFFTLSRHPQIILKDPQRSLNILKYPQRFSKILKDSQNILRDIKISSKILKDPQRSSKILCEAGRDFYCNYDRENNSGEKGEIRRTWEHLARILSRSASVVTDSNSDWLSLSDVSRMNVSRLFCAISFSLRRRSFSFSSAILFKPSRNRPLIRFHHNDDLIVIIIIINNNHRLTAVSNWAPTRSLTSTTTCSFFSSSLRISVLGFFSALAAVSFFPVEELELVESLLLSKPRRTIKKNIHHGPINRVRGGVIYRWRCRSTRLLRAGGLFRRSFRRCSDSADPSRRWKSEL